MHIDQNYLKEILNYDDNRINNLREATACQNQQNSPTPKHNRSGHKGVWWSDSRQKWRSAITYNKKTQCLGSFVDKEEAIEAYRAGALKFHGEFARV